MISKETNPDQYFETLPDDRKKAMTELRKIIKKNLPKGFAEGMSYGMVGYCVPHSIYPAGYHCDPKQPLPFMSIASQKNHIAVYHMGLYAHPPLLQWFTEAYTKAVSSKPDMGKGCVRFKKTAQIPFALIGELASKMTPQDWIALYEKNVKR